MDPRFNYSIKEGQGGGSISSSQTTTPPLLVISPEVKISSWEGEGKSRGSRPSPPLRYGSGSGKKGAGRGLKNLSAAYTREIRNHFL